MALVDNIPFFGAHCAISPQCWKVKAGQASGTSRSCWPDAMMFLSPARIQAWAAPSHSTFAMTAMSVTSQRMTTPIQATKPLSHALQYSFRERARHLTRGVTSSLIEKCCCHGHQTSNAKLSTYQPTAPNPLHNESRRSGTPAVSFFFFFSFLLVRTPAITLA